ncbi:hypothetical protein D3C73_885960 [compost metagenome]
MMRQAPLRHDRAATGNDAGQAFGGHWYIAQQYPGVDGEVIDALLGLFKQGIAEHFPGQVLRHAIHFLQRLIDWHCADRHRAVAQDPFTGFVDIAASGEIHHGVSAPAG